MTFADFVSPTSRKFSASRTFASVFARLKARSEIRQTHRALSALNDRELRDIGITRNEISNVAYGVTHS